MDTRPSPIAGRWYPGQADALARSVDSYLDAAGAQAGPPAEVVGLLAPHAGHVYSGPVAGWAFQAVRSTTFELVAVLCPSHFHDDGPLLTSGHDSYQTPLGQVLVDREAVGALRAALAALTAAPPLAGDPGPAHSAGGGSGVRRAGVRETEALVEIRRDREHAIEIQLPFLQRALAGEFRLLPLMLRDQSEPLVRALGQALGQVLAARRRALVLASSDLSHYYPQALAEQLDAEMLRQVGAFDPPGVLAAEASGRGQACGYGAIAAGLWAAQALGARRARVVKYATSGDVSGDFQQVVGYGAAVFLKG